MDTDVNADADMDMDMTTNLQTQRQVNQVVAVALLIGCLSGKGGGTATKAMWFCLFVLCMRFVELLLLSSLQTVVCLAQDVATKSVPLLGAAWDAAICQSSWVCRMLALALWMGISIWLIDHRHGGCTLHAATLEHASIMPMSIY